jgi:hypothetical protein
MDLYDGMTKAIGQYVADVKSSFPNSRTILKLDFLDY